MTVGKANFKWDIRQPSFKLNGGFKVTFSLNGNYETGLGS